MNHDLIYGNAIPQIEAYGDKLLQGVKLKSTVTGEITARPCCPLPSASPAPQDVKANGLFFAIGHQPATAFLNGQLALDADGYIQTTPGEATTSIAGGCGIRDVIHLTAVQ